MKTLVRRSRAETSPAAETAEAPVGQGSRWTAGRSLGSALVTVLLVVLLLMGPVALVISLRPAPAPVVAEEVPPGLTAGEQRAGGFAATYVAAWLSATRDDASGLSDFVDPSRLSLAVEPTEFRQLQVASIEPGADGLVSVTLTALVRETIPPADENAEPTDVWRARAFSAVVSAPAGGAMSVVGLPAPIAVSSSTEPVELAYSTPVAPSGPLSVTVNDFLQSYLAGVGDISRFTTPDSGIAAIAPAPFEQVRVDELVAAADVPDAPANGTRLEVLAQVALVGPERELTATYALTVAVRDGQWEVFSLNPSPITTTDQ